MALKTVSSRLDELVGVSSNGHSVEAVTGKETPTTKPNKAYDPIKVLEANGAATIGHPKFRGRITVGIVEISAAVAADWFSRSNGNRIHGVRHIDRLSRAISTGKWQFNGETIIFSKDGILLDGHGRLEAAAKSERSIVALVVYGIPEQAFATMDTGIVRRCSDVLTINGEPNAVRLASAGLNLWRHSKGAMNYKTSQPNTDEVIATINANQGVKDSLRWISSRKLVKIGSFVALHYLFSKIDPSAANVFFDAVQTAENMKRDDPRLQLHKILTLNCGATRKLPPDYLIAVTIKAWNLWRQGSTVKTMLYRAEEGFPEIAS